MNSCNAHTLGELVRGYCLRQFNDARKGYLNYLAIAKDVWERIFLRTLWVYQSEWIGVRKGEPYPYIKLPNNIQTLIGIFYLDDCGKEVPLFINNTYGVLAKPKYKQCGCAQSCNCGEGCNAISSLTYTSKTITFENDVLNEAGDGVVVSGTELIEKTWIEKCTNGDLLRWREVPTQKYLETPVVISDVSYSYQLEYYKESVRLCTLELKSCGCVEDSDLNVKKISEYCGCVISSCNSDLLGSRVDSSVPEIKFSPCGKMAYIIGGTQKEYLCKYQAAGASAKVLVPREAKDAIWDGIDYESKRFNPSVSRDDRREARNQFRAAQMELAEFYNPIDLSSLDRIWDKQKKW